jgi:hypothetical protein
MFRGWHKAPSGLQPLRCHPLTRAVFGVGALECPLFLSATASPLSVSSTLWTGWPPTISQPFCAARVMALLSISSSFTLTIWETLATDTHCDRSPAIMERAALQMRMARGAMEREKERRTYLTIAKTSSRATLACSLRRNPQTGHFSMGRFLSSRPSGAGSKAELAHRAAERRRHGRRALALGDAARGQSDVG